MTAAQAREISQLQIRVRQLEEALARQKEITSSFADRIYQMLDDEATREPDEQS